MNLTEFLNLHRPMWEEPGEPAGGGTPEGGEGGNAPSAPDFSFLPEAFQENQDVDGFRARFDELEAQDALRQEAMANVPEDASGYEWEVPEIDFGDLELPENFAFELNVEDENLAPVFDEFGGLLHKYNLPKEAASEFLGLLGKYKAAEYSPLWQAGQQEMESLGKSAESRLKNLERFFESKATSKVMTEGEAKAVMAMATSADAVRALEKLANLKGGNAPPQPAPKTREDAIREYYSTPT